MGTLDKRNQMDKSKTYDSDVQNRNDNNFVEFGVVLPNTNVKHMGVLRPGIQTLAKNLLIS